MDLWSGYTTHQVRTVFGSDLALDRFCSLFGLLCSLQFTGVHRSWETYLLFETVRLYASAIVHHLMVGILFSNNY